MERTAIEKLIKWNESARRKPLIVWGARQVGKTYLIKDILFLCPPEAFPDFDTLILPIG